MDSMLIQLLHAGRQYSPEYGNGLANHLPMTLIALQNLGADDARLQEYSEKYTARLEQKPTAAAPMDKATWRKFLGEHSHSAEYVQFFEAEIAECGVESVLRAYLPELIAGVGGGAFHPMIRVAYGLDVGSKEEVAEGLAAWCMAYMPIGSLQVENKECQDLGPYEILRILATSPHYREIRPTGANIFSRMQVVGADAPFQSLVRRLRSGTSLDGLAVLCRCVYLATEDNFTALHMITACHASRSLIQYMGHEQHAIQHLFTAVCAAYVTIDAPLIEPGEEREAAQVKTDRNDQWSETRALAVASDDDHVIKLVYTCEEEARVRDPEIYQAIAGAKVRRTS